LLAPEPRLVFVKVVKRAFSQRRKMMLKLLKQDWPAQSLENAFATSGLSSTIRAEAVSLENFVQLAQLVGAGGGSSA
jgi:16S rRNA A1518/A1519 N6-dimethyltransferase RsmA/KsgA/DIM1 with predicted DNA glycosylase/AP lyase activity